MILKIKQNLIKYEIDSDIEWLFLAQHYGLLTPLLDWSEDSLVALFFAVNNIDTSKNYDKSLELKEYSNFNRISEASAIFILDPGEYNSNLPYGTIDKNGDEHYLDKPLVVNEESMELINSYIYRNEEHYLPICIKAPKRE